MKTANGSSNIQRLADRFGELREQKKILEEALQSLRQRFIDLGPGRTVGSHYTVSFGQYEREAFDIASFKKANPKLYSKYLAVQTMDRVDCSPNSNESSSAQAVQAQPRG